MGEIQALKQKLDSKNMHGMIAAMPDHLEDGMVVGKAVNLNPLKAAKATVIIVAGMGGSAIAGDIVRSYLSDELRVPLIVIRNYRLPAFAGENALVICSSYSGNTEETLAAYDDARSKGAQMLVITSGGTLAEKAKADGVPVAVIKGGVPPRAALGYSFATLLTIVSRLGFCNDHSSDLTESIATLRNNRALYEIEYLENPAIDLAQYFYGNLPIMYAGCEKLEAVAIRFRGQINENAKSLAFINFFPELNHNEIVGWHKLLGLDEKFRVLILEDHDDHKRIKARIEIVGEYLSERGIGARIIESQGESSLDRIFYLIQLLDFTSYFLALLNGVDPYPVAAIDYLKDRLSKMN